MWPGAEFASLAGTGASASATNPASRFLFARPQMIAMTSTRPRTSMMVMATLKVVPDPGSGGADVCTGSATNLVAEPSDR